MVGGPPVDALRYEPPRGYLFAFYGLLGAWTAVCLPYLVRSAAGAGWDNLLQICMVGFVVAYTVYFSLGISHRVELSQGGEVTFTSLRRVLRVGADGIHRVEGPSLPVGFVRFRLSREKIYLFCLPGAQGFRDIVAASVQANPEVERKGL